MDLTTLPLILSIAYAFMAALLLNLNINTPLARPIKIGAIILVSTFYIIAYYGVQNLRGWAVEALPPEPFKLHWAIIEEPDKTNAKKNNESGRIFILAQDLSAHSALLGQPRLYGLPYSLLLAEQVSKALNQIENGQPIEARLTYEAAKNRDPQKLHKQTGDTPYGAAEANADILTLEFRDIPRANLPPKPAVPR